MNSSSLVFVAFSGLVGIVACSNSRDPSPSPAPAELNPQSCDCRICPCADTGNQCTHYTCNYVGPGQPYACSANPVAWTDGRYCDDTAAHHKCVVHGHCTQYGECSGLVGSNNEYFTCGPNGICLCGCDYNEGSGAYTCCDSYDPNFCTDAPTCIPYVPTCGNAVDTTDAACTMNHHC